MWKRRPNKDFWPWFSKWNIWTRKISKVPVATQYNNKNLKREKRGERASSCKVDAIASLRWFSDLTPVLSPRPYIYYASHSKSSWYCLWLFCVKSLIWQVPSNFHDSVICSAFSLCPDLQLLLEIKNKSTCTIPSAVSRGSISGHILLPRCDRVHWDLNVSDILTANTCFMKFHVYEYGKGQLGISSKMRVKISLKVGWKQS